MSQRFKDSNNSLEGQLQSADDAYFPAIPKDIRDNTLSYPERYSLLKTKLGAEHDKVELQAALKSLEDEITQGASDGDLYDRIILLNKHGKSHIESVISHASRLVDCLSKRECTEKCSTRLGECEDKTKVMGECNDSKKNKLSPFEIFILLCAIQIHDIGNKNGRVEHTTSFKDNFDRYANESFITDAVLKKCIYNIARVHGGKINGDADTVEAAKLRVETEIMKFDVRQRLLAAILRFADELADDNTRNIDVDNMPEYSKIFHAYSNSLHSVTIEKIVKESAYRVNLSYFLSESEALCERKKLEKDSKGNLTPVITTLLREIIKRTIKMEYERRYCARYFLPYFTLKSIRVVIEFDIDDPPMEPIEYTLEETGYPSANIELSSETERKIVAMEEKYASIGGVK